MTSIARIRQLMDADDAEKRLHHLWDRVCYRLDLCGLIFTQGVNIVILIVWLTTPKYTEEWRLRP